MPGNEDHITRINEILTPYNKDGHIIEAHTELLADLGLTSLQVMEIIEQIEDHYDVTIPLNVLPQVRTVGDLGEQLARITGSQQ
jgi:acyl carrier protein